MQPHLKLLLELQGVDIRLAAINDRLSQFPKHLAEVEARLTAAKKQITDAKEALTASLKERKTFEMDVQQWKERAAKYRSQSFEVKTNEAYKTLQHEAQNAESEAAKAEDRLLERMVSGEQYDSQLKAAEAAVKGVKANVEQERRAIQARYADAQKELKEAEEVRARVLAGVPEDLAFHYQRIAKRHGMGLAEIRGENCGQCGVHIRPHVLQKLQRSETDELFHCETCTRILYHPDQPAAAEPTAAAPEKSAPAHGNS